MPASRRRPISAGGIVTSTDHHLGRIVGFFLFLLVLGVATLRVGAAQGKSEVAMLCHQGRWQTLAPAEDPTIPVANQAACVSYGAEGGTIVEAQESNFLTFRATELATHCFVDVHLRNFAPNTAYIVSISHRIASNPAVRETIGTAQVTTDASGNADSFVASFVQHDIEAQAVAGGTASAWTAIAC